MTTPDLKEVVTEVDDIVRDIRPLLRGLIRVHIDTVRKLVDGYIAANRDRES